MEKHGVRNAVFGRQCNDANFSKKKKKWPIAITRYIFEKKMILLEFLRLDYYRLTKKGQGTKFADN